jgi:hypothetical protein
MEGTPIMAVAFQHLDPAILPVPAHRESDRRIAIAIQASNGFAVQSALATNAR